MPEMSASILIPSSSRAGAEHDLDARLRARGPRGAGGHQAAPAGPRDPRGPAADGRRPRSFRSGRAARPRPRGHKFKDT